MPLLVTGRRSVDAVEFIVSKQGIDVGAVGVQDERIYARAEPFGTGAGGYSG